MPVSLFSGGSFNFQVNPQINIFSCSGGGLGLGFSLGLGFPLGLGLGLVFFLNVYFRVTLVFFLNIFLSLSSISLNIAST